MSLSIKIPRGAYKNDMTPHPQTCMATPYNGKADKITMPCCGCGIPVEVNQNKLYPWLRLACSSECESSLLTEQDLSVVAALAVPAVEKKTARTDTCPSCKGIPLGRGYKHTEDCPDSTANKLKVRTTDKPATCPDCGGPSTRGRGWVHTATCARKTAVKVSTKEPFCPGCGGKSTRGRGWEHAEGCTHKATMKTYTPNPDLPKCPECGGTKRGRGFSHESYCSQSTIYKLAIAAGFKAPERPATVVPETATVVEVAQIVEDSAINTLDTVVTV